MADQKLPDENTQPSSQADTGSSTPQSAPPKEPAEPVTSDTGAMPATPTTPPDESSGAVQNPKVTQPVTPPMDSQQPKNDVAPASSDVVSDMAKPVQPPAAPVGTDDNLMGNQGVEKNKINGIKESVFSAQTGKMPDEAPSEEVKQEEPTPPSPPPAQQPSEPATSMPHSDAQDPMLAKTHEPVIIMPDRLEMGQVVSVKVKVGMIGHVMEDDHFIQSIELQAGGKSLGKVDLNPKQNPVAEAEFKVPLNAGIKIKAVSTCNKHGRWESEMSV